MARYLGGRLVSGAISLFLFVTLLFFLVNVALPGDFTSQFILTAEGKMTLQEALGLDRPLGDQYVSWLTGVVTLDFGTSFTGEPVWSMISRALPSTFFVLLLGVGFAFMVGSWLGRAAAYSDRPFASGVLTFISILLLTAFPPAVAVAIERAGRNVFGFVDYSKATELDHEIWVDSPLQPTEAMWRMVLAILLTVVGVILLRLLVARFWRRRLPGWVLVVLGISVPLLIWRAMGVWGPVFDLALAFSALLLGVVIITFGEVVLVTRAAMEDSMHEDFVMVARARGLPESLVRDKHAARAALLPVLSRFVVAIPYFLTGLVILESVFGGAGMGSLIFNAVTDQDIPVVVGSLLVVGALTLMMRVALDFAHALLDPRIRFEAGNGR